MTGTVGTAGLDVALTVSATDVTVAGAGKATSGTDYVAFGPATLTFAVTAGTTSIDSSTATVDVNDDKRLEGDEVVNLSIGSLSSTLAWQVWLGVGTNTVTIQDNEIGTINFQADQSNDESV